MDGWLITIEVAEAIASVTLGDRAAGEKLVERLLLIRGLAWWDGDDIVRFLDEVQRACNPALYIEGKR